ncbi:MAG: hypothetical protein K2K28_03625 [Clostridia bacterium]|nr:hypothetical protein [Clostridia bacterium]
MDRICGAVFDKIRSISPVGRYVIIAEDEFLEAFPEGANADGAERDRALTALRNGGYIDVKYSRGDMYCVAAVKEYAEEASDEDTQEVGDVITERRPRVDFVFVSAFLGGALGSLLISLIFAIV